MQYSIQVGSHKSRVGELPPSTCWPGFFSCSLGYEWTVGCKNTSSSCPDFNLPISPGSFLRAALNPLIPSLFMFRIALAQVQDLGLGLTELHGIHVGPLLKPLKVPPDGICSFKPIKCMAHFDVICKLAKGTLNSTMSLINMLNSTGPNMDLEGHCLLLISIWTSSHRLHLFGCGHLHSANSLSIK